MFMQFNEIKIIRGNSFKKVPSACPVCGSMMKDSDRPEFDKFNCCESCSMHFAQPNKMKWKKGWRPRQDEIDRMLKNKSLVPSYIMRGLKC